ncbi:MAG: hypothetical protein JW820_05040, partial [Spirochaetales bacterium]|nr:hypothetical protein [Spirochaetales bacterium]
MKRLRGVLLLLTYLCFAHYSTFGQDSTAAGEVVLPEEEAPEALFDGTIGDAGVDFFLTGSWTATLTGSLGWLLTPGGGTVFPSTFPGFETAQLFRQVPNLTLSVWLAERYFLETSVIGDFLGEGYDYFDENYLLLGYRGREGEFLRQVLLGTRDVGIRAYPYLEVPAAGSSSIGASALMAGAYSSHELLLRYDNNEPVSYTFLGRNLLSEEVLQLDDYERGRFFRLPDAGVTDLEVYIQDPDGEYAGNDSLRYRLAALEDAVLDAAAGTVSLREPAEGSVLVFYRKDGDDVGSAGLGIDALPPESGDKIDLGEPVTAVTFDWTLTGYFSQDMTERRITVNSREALRLWLPGEFSPFEILAAYPVEQALP